MQMQMLMAWFQVSCVEGNWAGGVVEGGRRLHAAGRRTGTLRPGLVSFTVGGRRAI